MNPSPCHYARALFRATRGLPPLGRQPPITGLPVHRKEPPRLSLFHGILETAPPTVPDLEPVETLTVTAPLETARPSAPTQVAGFLQLEGDRQKKAMGRFLLVSDGQVLAGTVEGAASEVLGHHVETSFRVPPNVVAKRLPWLCGACASRGATTRALRPGSAGPTGERGA